MTARVLKVIYTTVILQFFLSWTLANAQPYETSAVLDPNISLSTVTFAEHSLSFAYAGDAQKPGVLFIHGTPGGWGAFEVYLRNRQMQNDFFMVSVDRLGWGQSPLPASLINGDFELQAEAITAVLNQYPEKKWTIVGHSLGASMAPKVALKAPEQVDSLLLLAGSLDPKLGKPRWYNQFANTWAVGALIGPAMRFSNREIMGLAKQLRIMSKEIKATKLNATLTVMQGMKDKLVSPKNSQFALNDWQSNFAKVNILELPEEGHFLPWRKTGYVIDTIYNLRLPTTASN